MGFADRGRNPEFARWYTAQIADNVEAMDGRERRKYAIENRGLCLLISYTAEIIQQGSVATAAECAQLIDQQV